MMTIFIGNLPNDTKESQVQELFATFGSVAAIELTTWDSGRRFQGYGFVEMEEDAARVAIAELDGSIYRGAILCVTEATTAQLAQRDLQHHSGPQSEVPLDAMPPSNLLRRYYQVISVERAPSPIPGSDEDWYRYELQSGPSRITGLHRGTLEEVTEYATECAAAFNLRSMKGKNPRTIGPIRKKQANTRSR